MSVGPKEVFSVKEVAEYLGLSESKVRQLVPRGAIPYVRIDVQYRFYLPRVQEWLRKQSVNPTTTTVSENAKTISTKIWNDTVEK